MRGEFLGVWSESWREIWSKLSRHPKAPNDLFSELYRVLDTAISVPPHQTDEEKASAQMRLAEILNDPALARKAFMKTKSKNLYQFRLHRNDIALVFGHQWKQVIPLIKEDCFSRTWQR